MVRIWGSKVKWSGHSLKVYDERDKVVAESNLKIFKSHLNQDVQVCIATYGQNLVWQIK